jgi:hypothetical protein
MKWSKEEDDLLLTLLRKDYPGSRSTEDRKRSWKEVVDCMNEAAQTRVIVTRRTYTESSIIQHYNTELKPRFMERNRSSSVEGKSDPASHTATTGELNSAPLPETVVSASNHLSTLEPYTEASGPPESKAYFVPR